MTFGLSLGCVHTFFPCKNKDAVITLYRENFKDEINAIELTMSEKDFKNFNLSQVNFEWLRNMKYVSIHLLGSVGSYRKIMSMIKRNKLRVNNFISHIYSKNTIPQFFKDEFGNNILIENIERDYALFPDEFKICFDYSHAIKNGSEFAAKFANLNEFSIKQVHLSNTINGICHRPFIKDLFHFDFVKNVIDLKNYPIIIESVCEDIIELREEVKVLKRRIYE
jgi:hypothetical protein